MNFEFFLAKRMRSSTSSESTVSMRIIKIAITAIALGVIMILIALGTSLGLQKEIKAKTIALSGHLRIAPFENNNSSISVTPIKTTTLEEVYWKEEDKIAHQYPFISKGVLFKSGNEFEGGIVKGLDHNFPKQKLEGYLVEGKFPIFGSLLSKEIILSATLAQKLNLSIGDRVTSYFQNTKEGGIPKLRYFNLSGIYQTGFPDFDNNYGFIDLRHLQRINQWKDNEIGGVEVFTLPGTDVKAYAASVYNKLPPHIDVQTVDELYRGIFDWIALFDFNVLIILIVMIIVGTLNMATALLVLILERSRMIGVLKTLGATGHQIQQLFLINAGYIILKGLVIGNVLGGLILFSQQKYQWLRLDPATYFVEEVPIDLPPEYVIGLNLLVFGVCISILWLPTIIIGKIDPTKVLKYR